MSVAQRLLSPSLTIHPSRFRAPSVGLVSTFPPTPCGLATFAAALATGLQHVGVDRLGVVRSTTDETLPWDDRVVSILRPGNPISRSTAARALNDYDCVLVQHEYGIFGGDSGAEVLDLLADLAVPVIPTLHTVPLSPSRVQRHVLETLVDMGAAAVTMTDAARRRLIGGYDVDPDKVVVIPHGATVVSRESPPSPNTFTLLTWGLLGPGKGVEWVIDAMGIIADDLPHVRYVVAGQTHPKVFERDGDRYRNMLMDRAVEREVADRVLFDSKYRTLDDLGALVAGSSVVVLPYDSTDQITSGVLVDALAAGRPVIATEFPHAVELVGDGTGLLVAHRNPDAIASAIRHVVMHPGEFARMEARAETVGLRHDWRSVAATYCALMDEVTSRVETP
jgi:glycosyltransferase involved in cell wall biosynthesis